MNKNKKKMKSQIYKHRIKNYKIYLNQKKKNYRNRLINNRMMKIKKNQNHNSNNQKIIIMNK